MNQIDNWNHIQDMINHWLKVPENGYLGSSYGYKDTLAVLLENIPNDQVIQKIILKMREDLPILEGKQVSLNWIANSRQISITVDGNTAIFQLDS
ncbi:hypothetical protein CRENPOLYSF2_3860002 [Crenothrix polyspora]|uniref:Uncharacterized protein n=1 Tax=Crenothrix polyspora TaxID=360316 RepID=A0A1R4HED5_9GAMM|nr:hypothetical protein [Crenothrix polyspora]SJM94250.1 hypothetical protein CRENPOLYSF2_3860002 [Crenothrix polyspora]